MTEPTERLHAMEKAVDDIFAYLTRWMVHAENPVTTGWIKREKEHCMGILQKHLGMLSDD